MRAPTRILRANGVRQLDLAERTNQSVQYVSMQLNSQRPLTRELLVALHDVLSDDLVDQVILRRGEV